MYREETTACSSGFMGDDGDVSGGTTAISTTETLLLYRK